MSKICYPLKIIDSKFENNKCYFLVQWKKFKECTWEPEDNIKHREDLIEEYKNIMRIENMNLQNNGFIYCRVSSKKQSLYNKGHTSLEVQEKELRDYCASINVNVIKCIKEVYSGRSMDKMKGLHYLCCIASEYQNIYVYDISRFSRNAHHALNILECLNTRNISVYSLKENISYKDVWSRNQFRIQLSAANFVSDVCCEKVKASISFRRARGDYIGSTPYGFSTSVDEITRIRLKIPNKEEMKVIELICQHDSVGLSSFLISEQLNSDKIKYRTRNFTPSNVKRIIQKFKTDFNFLYKAAKKCKSKKTVNPY